jgi:hypothetical protein
MGRDTSTAPNGKDSIMSTPPSNTVLVHGGFVDGSGCQGIYDLLTTTAPHSEFAMQTYYARRKEPQ